MSNAAVRAHDSWVYSAVQRGRQPGVSEWVEVGRAQCSQCVCVAHVTHSRTERPRKSKMFKFMSVYFMCSCVQLNGPLVAGCSIAGNSPASPVPGSLVFRNIGELVTQTLMLSVSEDPECRLSVSDHTVAPQYSGSAGSVCEEEVKAEAADWGTFLRALMEDLCVEAAYRTFVQEESPTSRSGL